MQRTSQRTIIARQQLRPHAPSTFVEVPGLTALLGTSAAKSFLSTSYVDGNFAAGCRLDLFGPEVSNVSKSERSLSDLGEVPSDKSVDELLGK